MENSLPPFFLFLHSLVPQFPGNLVVVVEMAAAVTGTSKNENSEEGVFSDLYSLQFQEGRTNSLCFSWLIVVFCFVYFYCPSSSTWARTWISSQQSTTEPASIRAIRAPSFWLGNQKGWRRRIETYQTDFREEELRKLTWQIYELQGSSSGGTYQYFLCLQLYPVY